MLPTTAMTQCPGLPVRQLQSFGPEKPHPLGPGSDLVRQGDGWYELHLYHKSETHLNGFGQILPDKGYSLGSICVRMS